MQRHDAQLVRAAAPPVVALTAAAAVVSGLVAGARGVLGAVLGGALVVAFFGVGHVISGLVTGRSGEATMAIALATYGVKIALLGVFLAVFVDTTLFAPEAFGWTALAATIVWLGLEVRTFTRLKILYVQPVEDRHDRG